MGKTTQTAPCHCPTNRSDHHKKQLTECSHVKPVNLILIHLIKNKFHYNEITFLLSNKLLWDAHTNYETFVFSHFEQLWQMYTSGMFLLLFIEVHLKSYHSSQVSHCTHSHLAVDMMGKWLVILITYFIALICDSISFNFNCYIPFCCASAFSLLAFLLSHSFFLSNFNS